MNFWDAVSAVGTWAGVIITSILTFIIIKQTGKINQRQIYLDKKLNEQQIELQKRQIKVDVFPYRREIYHNIFKVMEFSNFITTTLLKFELENMTCKQIYEMYNTLKNSYSIDVLNIVNSLREAQYILPNYISPTVSEIYTCFDETCSSFMIFNTIGDILTDNQINEVKQHNINRIKDNCNKINSKVGYIQSIMPNELNISNLDT